jgi:hypothetical protein
MASFQRIMMALFFSVKAAVPKASSLKYNGNFKDNTFDPMMSNKV